MMLDQDIVAASPTSVYRVLSAEGLLDRWNRKPSKKGTGFVQPVKLHEHWHVDISYRNIAGTFYYMFSILDGASRAIIHWDIREAMTEFDVECIIERAREIYPEAKPRIISDNGPQFIAKDFKVFIRIAGMTHVRTSPYYPQSNGKLERYHKTIKADAIRPSSPGSLDEAKAVVASFVAHNNGERLHSAIGYVTPNDFLAGRHDEIWVQRDRKLEAAREARRIFARRPRRHLSRRHVALPDSRPHGHRCHLSEPVESSGDRVGHHLSARTAARARGTRGHAAVFRHAATLQ
jgi:transposase InsO family protein